MTSKKDADLSASEMYEWIKNDMYLAEVEIEGKDQTFSYEEENQQYLLFAIEKFVVKVIKSKTVAFEVTRIENKSPSLKDLPLSIHYGYLFAFIQQYSPGFSFSEYVTLFFDSCLELRLSDILPHVGPRFDYPDHDGKLGGELFNDLILLIRQKASTKTFQKKLYNRKYNSKRNYESAERYIAALFDAYPKLLVLRMDFSFLKEHRASITHDMASKYIDTFLNNKRSNSLFAPWVGYIIKREQAVHDGLHFHLIIFYEGEVAQRDIYLAEKINDYWKSQITDGKGWAFNCNRRKHKYKNCGIGMINHSDLDKRENLLLAVNYLTKKEQYLRIKASNKSKVFRMGQPPKKKKSKAGRPRKVLASPLTQ